MGLEWIGEIEFNCSIDYWIKGKGWVGPTIAEVAIFSQWNSRHRPPFMYQNQAPICTSDGERGFARIHGSTKTLFIFNNLF